MGVVMILQRLNPTGVRGGAAIALTTMLFLLFALAMGQGALAQDGGTPTVTPTPTLPPPDTLPASGTLTRNCGAGVRPRGPDFEGHGLILTTFSRDALWVVDLDRDMRYPLPGTRPCGPNCRPSPDRRSLLYVSPETATFWLMSVDGVQRESVFPYYVSALEWWDADHWLAWPTAGSPAIYPIDGQGEPLRLNGEGVYSVQPGGYYGLRLAPGDGEWPVVELVNLLGDETAQPLFVAQPYFGGTYWSPGGALLAYIGHGERDESLGLYGAELYAIRPGAAQATRLTDLTAAYGAVRIAGEQEEGAVSWSPDGRYLAFWVMEIIGPDVVANVGHAVIHVLDTATGQVTAYCGFATDQHTPNPPGLVWSPDSRFVAFGVDVPQDGRGALLLALDITSGDYTEVTEGMYAAYGSYDPVMWGTR